MRSMLTIAVVLAAVPVLSTGPGCGRGGGAYVYVVPERFLPVLPAELHAYQGHPVHLSNFANVASETERDYYFYSADGLVVYEASGTISAFLRDAFAKALAGLGMPVYVDEPEALDPSIPELRATIVRMTEGVLHVQIQLRKYAHPVYQQEYRIEAPPPSIREEKALEQSVYHNVNLALTGMLMDQAFQAAFFQ